MGWCPASGINARSCPEKPNHLTSPNSSHTPHPPIITVGSPTVIVPPWAVLSPMRAAGLPPINTVAEPFTTESGGPTQTQLSPTTAAGRLPISTVGQPGPTTGPPTWGIGGVPGVCIGQLCRSVRRAAGGIGGWARGMSWTLGGSVPGMTLLQGGTRSHAKTPM
jgi:hypothetical protein